MSLKQDSKVAIAADINTISLGRCLIPQVSDHLLLPWN